MPDSERGETNPLAFQKTIGEEFKATQNRVRHLIGDQNWGEEGRYKESILKNTLKSFLPENVGIGTGFIIKKKNDEIFRSSQIDIIIYDTQVPALMKEGDFVITTPEHVYAIIEVKTNIDAGMMADLIRKRDKNLNVIKKDTFYGIFSFDNKEINRENAVEKFRRLLEYSKGQINHVSLGGRLFIRYHPIEELHQNAVHTSNNIDGYWGFYEFKKLNNDPEGIDLDGLAPAYFISNLVEFILKKKKRQITANNRFWFLFPLDGGKTPYQIATIEVPSAAH